MGKTVLRFAVILAGWCFSGLATAHAQHAHHGHAHSQHLSKAGVPGNPKAAARMVTVRMGESDGKMLFIPDRIEVKRGEQIRFILENIGELDHEFVLGMGAEIAAHAEEMKKSPDMKHHDEPNGRTVEPKKSTELLWRFTTRGEFIFACLIPGHIEAGMKGIVVVK